MLANFKDNESKLLLRFSKNRTIKLSSSGESGSSDENRHQLESSEDSQQEVKVKKNNDNAMADLIKKSVLEQVRIKTKLKEQVLEEDIHSKKIQAKLKENF